MDRRDFMKSAGAGAALLTVPGGLRARAATSSGRPNIVLIMVDDMGYSDIGCFGSEIDTPNLDRLASGGLRFTQFYNAARCCPTRASLLTGLYPHQAGMGHMAGPEFDYGKPGYRGHLKDECVTVAEVLKGSGYHTFMTGKWHVGHDEGMWPVDRGFEDYYGILQGAGNYFKPDKMSRLTRNDKLVESGEGFYATDAFTDYAVDFIDMYHKKDDKPCFLYVAYNAPHWPLHAKPEDIEKYKGRYLKGWEVLRKERYERQLDMGIVNPDWPLSERDRRVPAWDKVSPERQKDMAHRMAVYAAMVDCMDQNIGRILEAIEKTGEMDNTLILFLSDNGACHEFGKFGTDFPSWKAGNAVIGTEDSFSTYGRSWSNACNTPFRLHKHWTHEGGISTPLVAHWPRMIKECGSMTDQPGHVIDIMATCLEAAGATYPETYKGNDIIPIEGRSLMPVFKGKTREGHEAIYWEHEGNRAVRKGDWKLVSDHPFGWELYNLKEDRTEMKDLARKHPEKVRELTEDYEEWAKRCWVEPWNPLDLVWSFLKVTIKGNL